MPYTDSKDREVEDLETELEIGEGCYVIGATYVDDGTEVPDDELEYLTEAYQGELYEDAYSSAASDAHDSYKDSYKYGDD